MEEIEIWVVYDHPKDYPHEYVARLNRGFVATDTIMRAPSLEAVRAAVQHVTPYVLTSIPRSVSDDPVIVECLI